MILIHAIADPVVPHVDGLGAALLGADADGGGVVRRDRGSRLGPSEVLEGTSEFFGCATIEEEGGILSLEC